jgi:hypothetical protein
VVGDFPVQWFTRFHQANQTSARIIDILQQRPLLVATRAFNLLTYGSHQVYHDTALAQVLAILFGEHGAASGGQYYVIHRTQFLDHIAFPLAKAFFTLDIENPCDVGTCPFLDYLVGVEEILVQLFGQQPPNRGFAGAHWTDEKYVVEFGCHVAELQKGQDSGDTATLTVSMMMNPTAIH